LADGQRIKARLLVLATGMGDSLRSQLGIKRRALVEKHSVTFGFDIQPGFTAEPKALTFYGTRGSGIDYLTLFPVPGAFRANLFSFLPFNDPWVRQFRDDPRATLVAVLPELERFLGDFKIVAPVQTWIMDLAVVENHRQAGVVVIGDAFQTSCPAAGTGVSRLLVDVERLCSVHIPDWLGSADMDAEKISRFYDDPKKRASDVSALHAAEFRRSFTLDPTLKWAIRRQGQFLRRRLLEAGKRGAGAFTGKAKRAR